MKIMTKNGFYAAGMYSRLGEADGDDDEDNGKC